MSIALITRRRLVQLALVAAVALLLLTACGSTAGPTQVADEIELVAPTAEATASEPPAAPTAEATVEPTAQAPTPDETTEVEPTEVPSPDTGTESETSDVPVAGVLTDVIADAGGGRSVFDGTVDEISDLDDIVTDVWGDGGLGLHRGHAQIENVLEAFLGINHDQMHDYMDDGLNLADTSEALGLDPEALVETLVYSYRPYVDEGVANGVINANEREDWVDIIRTEFSDRVYWDGVSDS